MALCKHKGPYMSEEGTGVRDRDVMTEAEIRGRGSCEDDTLLALSMEEGGLGSRSAGSFQKPEKAKAWAHPHASRRRPCQYLPWL